MKIKPLLIVAAALGVVSVLAVAGVFKSSHTALLSGPRACTPVLSTGVMGKCVPKPPQTHALTAVAPGRGCVVVDVSEWNGYPNWQQAKPHICGAVVRLGDGNWRDKHLAYNAYWVRRLHIWHAFYLFVRPWKSCADEGRWALGLVPGGLDSGPLIGDFEVPLPYGCQRAFSRAVEAASGWRVAEDYSSVGTWPGGPVDSGTLQWDAAYGPVPGCAFSPCHRNAWQHTDGVVGALPRYVPGIGFGDVSRDEGLVRLVKPRPKPKPKPRPKPKHSRKALVAYWRAERTTTLGRYHAHGCSLLDVRPACRYWRVREHVLWRDIRHG